MVTITKDPSIITVIHVYTVAPVAQAGLAASLAEAIERFGHTMPGHLSSSVHLSRDGSRVTSYSQWDAERSKALFEHPPALERTLADFAPYVGDATGQDFAMYDVYFSKSYR